MEMETVVKARYNTDILRRERLKLGLTMSELARRIGVTPPIVSRVESGAVQSPKTIAKIAMELRVSLEELLR